MKLSARISEESKRFFTQEAQQTGSFADKIKGTRDRMGD